MKCNNPLPSVGRFDWVLGHFWEGTSQLGATALGHRH